MQATGLASVPASPCQAAAAPAARHQQSPQPFAFVPMGADNNDSPQLHVPPPVILEAQQHVNHPPSQLHAVQREYTQPEYTQPGPTQTAQGQAHESRQLQPQLQRRPPQLQPLREGPSGTAASQLQQTWQDQPQDQYVNQSTQQLPSRQLPREQLEQQPGSNPATASVSKHQTQAQYRYPQLPQASQLVPPQGNQGLYPAAPAAVITSGAMGGPSMWGRAEGRSGSPALQPQASST